MTNLIMKMHILSAKLMRHLNILRIKCLEFRAKARVDQSIWSTQPQPGEFMFHFNNKWRASQEFEKNNKCYFENLGFKEDDYAGKTIIDLGAGSKLRSAFFRNSKIIAIEPLAKRFINEIPWCDLNNAASVYSTPGEETLAECTNVADFIMCINVLDHCYDTDALIMNIASYLKNDGAAFISFDKHDIADSMHPLALDEKSVEKLFSLYGLIIERFRRGGTFGHGKYSLNYWLRKEVQQNEY